MRARLSKVIPDIFRKFSTSVSDISPSSIRTQPNYLEALKNGVIETLYNSQTPENEALPQLTPEQKQHHLDSMALMLGAAPVVSKDAVKAAFPLASVDAAQFSVPFVGMVDTVLQKNGQDPKALSAEEVKDSVKFISYYRTQPQMEEYARLGMSVEDAAEARAKANFLGRHSGAENDPAIFSRMTTTYYPTDSHMELGSNDLGRATHTAMAEQYARAKEGMDIPFNIINGGDSTPMTQGFNDGMNFLRMGQMEGFENPSLFVIQANNRSISTQLDKRSVSDAFSSYGNLFCDVSKVDAKESAEALEKRDGLIDKVTETGRPGVLILQGSERLTGHATEGYPGADEHLMNLYQGAVNTLSKAVLDVCGPDLTPQMAAQILESKCKTVEEITKDVTKGTSYMSFDQAKQLSVKGADVAGEGKIVDVDHSYWTNPNPGTNPKSGGQIFGKTINDIMDKTDARLIHQEGADPKNPSATMGVYNQLVALSEENLEKVRSFPINEQVQAEYSAALRRVAPESLPIDILPHMRFADHHARASVVAASYEEASTGRSAAHWAIMDAGSLAVVNKDGAPNAKVGEYHNSQECAPWNDTNTTTSIPMDANHFAAMADNCKDLVAAGRQVVTHFPTKAYGMDHKESVLPENMGVNDVIRTDIEGDKPANGKKLAVVTGGYITPDVIKELEKTGVEASVFVMSSTDPSKALTKALGEELEKTKGEMDVVLVDPSPRGSFLGPAMSWMQKELGNPEEIRSLLASTDQTYIPYGAGNAAFNVKRDFIEDVLVKNGIVKQKDNVIQFPKQEKKQTQALEGQGKSGDVETVAWHFPFGDRDEVDVEISTEVEVGQRVKKDQLLGTAESDKAATDIYAQADGVVSSIIESANTGESVKLKKDASVSIIDIEASKAQVIDMPVQEVQQVSQEQDVISTRLSGARRGMVKNMSVDNSRYKPLAVAGYLDMERIKKESKEEQISPTLQIVREAAKGILETGLNVKLSEDGKSRNEYLTANIGLAVESKDGDLRVLALDAVAKKDKDGNVTMKPTSQLKEDYKALLARNEEGRLTDRDTDLSNVALVVTSLGKNAPIEVDPTLNEDKYPAILGVGAMDENTGMAKGSLKCCHATYTGSEVAKMLEAVGAGKDNGIARYIQKVVGGGAQQPDSSSAKKEVADSEGENVRRYPQVVIR